MRITLCDNQAEWNQAVLQLGGTLYQSWQWGELRRSRGWLPWRVLVEDAGTVQAAMQIFERRTPLVPAIILYAPHGIARRRGEFTLLDGLVEWLRGFLAERKAVFLRIDPDIADTDEQEKSRLTGAGFRSLSDWGSIWNQPRATMVLDIAPSERDLLNGMRRAHKQHICQGPKKGLTFECGSDVRHVQTFYDLLRKSSQRKGYSVRGGRDYFLEMQRTLLAEENGRIFLAFHEREAVAGVLCSRFGDRCHNLYNGFDWHARNLGANQPLQWKAIQWAKDAGCRWYDTGGLGTSYPPTEGNLGYGVYNYKKGFGATVRHSLGLFDLVNRPASYAVLRSLERQHFLRAFRSVDGFWSRANSFSAKGQRMTAAADHDQLQRHAQDRAAGEMTPSTAPIP